MLWLALHLPHFAVEIHAIPGPAATLASGRIVAVDPLAEQAGVRPGMGLGSALGLAPGLTVRATAPRGEAAALAALACWAGRFTPQVSLAPPSELLLEIGGCLRLFGGLESLLAHITTGLQTLGHVFHLGLAPTPLAAQWLARASAPAALPPTGLARALAPLPLAVLHLAAGPSRQLAALGVKRLGDLLALPRAGLARRFGPELPGQLARALGEQLDPRPAFPFPEHFSQRLELPAKVERADMLLFAAHRLMLALAGWLAARSGGLRTCRLVLIHDDAPPTPLTLGFAGPTRDPARLLRVLRERLERLALTTPVTELRLAVDAVESLPGQTAGLFGEAGTEAIAPVVERLRARLGPAAVHGLTVAADYRPEWATRAVDTPRDIAPSSTPSSPRPLGLLPTPLPLPEREGAPWHNGRLRLLTRAERIESGWWDGGEGPGDQRRDYFVAMSGAGEWLWVFRNSEGWWLHGCFV